MAGKLGAVTATLENIELCSLSTFEFGAPARRLVADRNIKKRGEPQRPNSVVYGVTSDITLAAPKPADIFHRAFRD
jgi:hypothetical protein